MKKKKKQNSKENARMILNTVEYAKWSADRRESWSVRQLRHIPQMYGRDYHSATKPNSQTQIIIYTDKDNT